MNTDPHGLPRITIRHKIPMVAAGLAATFAVDSGVRYAPGGADRVDEIVVADYDTAMEILLGRERSADPTAFRRSRVLVLAQSAGGSHVRAALEAGAFGYALLDCDAGELRQAVTMMGRGSRYLCTCAAASIADSFGQEALTTREQEVLFLVARGLTNKMIARDLQIALETVKTHLRAVFAKLNVSTRLQAAIIAAEHGISTTAGLGGDTRSPSATARQSANALGLH